MSDRRCKRCNAPLDGVRRDATYCSADCRRRGPLTHCDCGAIIERGRDSAHCRDCARRVSAETRRVWTRELVTDRIREWAATYGDPPAIVDWNPHQARVQLRDEERARRFEDADGYWPSKQTVFDIFGSWNAAITAAGFIPRAPHGGAGNQQRRRDMRVAA